MAVGQGTSGVNQALRGLPTTARQIDSWVRSGYILASESGSGYTRLFTPTELRVLRKTAQLVAVGVKPAEASVIARSAVEHNASIISVEGSPIKFVFGEDT